MLGWPRRVLIVAPHPDDETIGAHGLIRALAGRRGRVRVLVVADGAASHPNSAAWPPMRLVAARRRETRRVLARAGLWAGDISFLSLPDGALTDLGGAQRRRIACAAAAARPTLIVGPDIGDAHPDHRAVAAVLAAAILPGARRLSYLVWPRPSVRGRGAPCVLTLGCAGAAAKRAAVRGYATQMGAIRDDPGGFAIARHEFRAFTRPQEQYRELR